jgi:hypothetical protein
MSALLAIAGTVMPPPDGIWTSCLAKRLKLERTR